MEENRMPLPELSVERSNSRDRFFQWVMDYVKPLILPVLVALVPTLYHYSNNVEKLTLLNLSRMLVFNSVLAGIIYFVMLVFHRFQAIKAANASFIFLIFFNVYGLLYRYFLDLDVIRIKHYTFLPFTVMLASYGVLLITKLKTSTLIHLWKNLVLVTSVLVLFNLIKIVPAEIQRWRSEQNVEVLNTQETSLIDQNAPDIYYIILDEFAGFQAMREYWGYHEVDGFVSFLEDRGFFVAEESHGSSTDTLHQMATRLNYQEYPLGDEHIQTYFNDIADNRAMRYLKSRGYTTVVFDETNMGYPSSRSILADYVYEYGSSSIPQSGGGVYELYFDEFGELVIDNTMLYVFSEEYKKNNPSMSQHSSMIYFTLDNIPYKRGSSPKFVYVHLLLPHAPFMFSQSGQIVDYERITNWNYYIDNYIFSIKVAESMIDGILSEANLENPPVIILQSDHGARNHLANHEGSVILSGYPEEFKTLILYALFLPGYDYSSLPQDINPINTFPIVFNYLFDANFTLME